MKLPDKFSRLARVPKLTRTRIVLAIVIAMFADGLQLLLGPFGWAFGDQIIDVITMLLTGWLIGFHWLLLPTFVLELIPFANGLPTWTACVVAVIVLRKRQQRSLECPPQDKPPAEI